MNVSKALEKDGNSGGRGARLDMPPSGECSLRSISNMELREEGSVEYSSEVDSMAGFRRYDTRLARIDGEARARFEPDTTDA